MIKVLRRLFVIKVIFLFTLTFFLVNSHIGEFNPIYRTLYDVWYNLLSTLTKISSLNFGDLFYLILLFIFFYFLLKRNKLRRRDYILRLILFVMVIFLRYSLYCHTFFLFFFFSGRGRHTSGKEVSGVGRCV